MAALYLLVLFIGTSLSATCDVEPFQVPIQDVHVVSSIPGAIMKGIRTTVGTPPQQIALLPWAELNNTWIYDSPGFCDKSVIFSDEICQVRRGNFFSEDDSTSWRGFLDIVEAGGAPTELEAPNAEKGVSKLVLSSLGGTDNFNLGAGGNLSDFAFGIPRLAWDAGYSTMHTLGLGQNSTYLNALLASGHIGSRVWSLFWGRMWSTQTPMDGAIVFGGYDRKKVIGKNYTQALDFSSSGCATGMKVTVSDIKVNFRDGTDESLFQPNTALQLCILPQRQLLMEVPAAVYDTFENVTNTRNVGLSFGLHWSAHVFAKDTAFDGDITIQLSSGLEIRIPNDQYIVPPVFVERNGTRIINDDGSKEVLIGSLAAQSATLGRYFLTAAYLMVNHDANSFTIWQANPTSNSELVSVLDEKTAESCVNTTAVVQPPAIASGTSTLTQPPSASSSASSSKSKTAIIAGSVVGGIAAVCIFVFIFLYVRRRKRAERNASSVSDVLQSNGSRTGDTKILRAHQAVELQVSNGGFSELQGSRNNIYEMPGGNMTPEYQRYG